MNTLVGEIVEIYIEEGTVVGKVRIGRSFIRVPLLLLMDAKVGDHVVIDSGVALSKVDLPQLEEDSTCV